MASGSRHVNALSTAARIGSLGVAIALCNPSLAVDFTYSGLDVALDTTLSHGYAFRHQRPDLTLVARANGGLGNSPNGDDGTLNYRRRGLVSSASKVTSDLDLRYGNVGAFVRASGFLDAENDHGTRERTALTDNAKLLVGRDFDILDFYAHGSFDVGDVAAEARFGKHVLSWGESTFIQNSINVVNPFDVSKLRVPGAELREALLPVPMFSLAVAPTFNLSMEGFYQLDWDKTEIEPPGSFFSTNDFVGAGGRKTQLGFGSISDLV